MSETWNEWFAKWCVERGVLANADVKALRNTDHYAIARRMFGHASWHKMGLQLDGALAELNGAARAARPRRR